jgi:DNA replication protein DnaC
MIAISLDVATAQSGRRVYYGTLGDLITSLEEAQRAGRLTQRLNTLVSTSQLVVDEIGYLHVSRTGAMLFLQLMLKCYEHASTVLTSNESFSEWGDGFGDDVMAPNASLLAPTLSDQRGGSLSVTGIAPLRVCSWRSVEVCNPLRC